MSSRHPTINAADLIDHSELFGSITPGKSADIIAVQGDPLADIRTLENVAIGPIAGAAIVCTAISGFSDCPTRLNSALSHP
jgi:imidazolonepropionase-like amidohydrolase